MAKIMVIDDAQPTRAKMRMFLEEAGYTVLEGTDGEDGLGVLRNNKDVSLSTVTETELKLDNS